VSGDVAGDPNLVSGGNDPSSFPERPDDWNCPGDQPLITAEPEIICSTISEDDDFVLLASDGLWDVYSNEEVLDMVKHEMTSHRDAQRTCEVLTERAISERYTRDNVSVVLVKFQ
jgi:serine/threonine protein phosphatase PrpC